LHLNITSAAIDTFDDAMFSYSSPNANYSKQTVSDLTRPERSSHGDITLLHSPAELIDELERRAFALKNNTGQPIRVHTLSSTEPSVSECPTRTLYYLDHLQTMPLSFPATLTSIQNLMPIEIAAEETAGGIKSEISHHHHLVDIQVPGFKWLHGVSIEETGRNFFDLIPRCPEIQSKINSDWRLGNGLQLLADVQSVNGGRRLSLYSPFEVVNKTDHAISLSLSPDPRHFPQYDNEESTSDSRRIEPQEINPGKSQCVLIFKDFHTSNFI
jgi:hypothetical protein